MKNVSLLAALCVLEAANSLAQQQQPAIKTDVWGVSPPASDDRFSNPQSKLYAGPNGYWNTGEVR